MNDYLSLSEAAKLVPGRPAASTIWRWARKEVISRNGQRFRLEHCRIGARVFVTGAELQRFFDALTAADLQHFDTPKPEAPPKAPTRQRQKQIARAEKVLVEAGIMPETAGGSP